VLQQQGREQQLPADDRRGQAVGAAAGVHRLEPAREDELDVLVHEQRIGALVAGDGEAQVDGLGEPAVLRLQDEPRADLARQRLELRDEVARRAAVVDHQRRDVRCRLRERDEAAQQQLQLGGGAQVRRDDGEGTDGSHAWVIGPASAELERSGHGRDADQHRARAQ
jgi:hypothetical protein